MKKLLAILMAISMMFSILTVEAFATEEEGLSAEEAVMYNSEGEELKFRLESIDDGKYVMKFYIEGELIRIYDIDLAGSPQISAIDVAANQIQEYFLPEAVREIDPLMTCGRVRWTSLGYVHYAKSSKLGAETCAAISARSSDYYEDKYAIDTAVSNRVDALVTFVAGALLGTKLPVPVGGWLGIAQSLVEAAITTVGAEVLGDIISIPFKEYYYCIVTEYEVAGTVVGNGNGIQGERAVLTGTKYSVEYQEDVFNDSYEGYTPSTWKTTEFARDLWIGSMPGITYPGHLGFPATYPL